MKETDFIDQNKEKWNNLEKILNSPEKDPDRLTNLFIETTDDLSFSRTYYPNRSVRVYLNGVAQQVFQIIYKNKSREKGRIRKFWFEDMPEAMWHSRMTFLYAFLIFAGGFLIGIYSSIHYPGFARIILGDGYIAMTEANIESGNPMAVYGDSSQIEMFLTIAWNNVPILFWAYVLGILFGLGTIYIVLYNAIMFGAFVYFFIERDLLEPFFYAVMLHGTLELSMIVIGGAAGLSLGRGLIFPGTYSRLQSLLLASRQSIKILLAGSIFLVIAAFIESFATRYTDMPNIMRGLIIFLSLGIVIGYFIWYPRYRNRKGLIPERRHDEIVGDRISQISLTEIKTNGKIFTELFSYFSNFWKRIIFCAFVVTILTYIFHYLLYKTNSDLILSNYDYYGMPWFVRIIWIWNEYEEFFLYEQIPLLYVIHSIFLAGILTWISSLMFRITNMKVPLFKQNIRQFTSNILVAGIALTPLFLPSGLTLLLSVFLWPFCMFVSATSFQENRFFAIKRSLSLISGNFWKLIGLFFSTLGVQWLTLMIAGAPVIYLLASIVEMNVYHESAIAGQIFFIVCALFSLFVLIAMIPLSIFSSHLFYLSAIETNEARHLRNQISSIGFKKRAYGLEKEI